MRKVIAAPFIFLIYFIGYLIVCAILAGVIWYFFPTAGMIIGGLLVLGAISNAWEKTREKLGHLSTKQFQTKMAKQWSREELEEFNKSLSLVSRRIH